jgi:hypothetical protein
MPSTQPNLRAYFQHESLTKIRGEPINENLTKMEREVCADGKEIFSTTRSLNSDRPFVQFDLLALIMITSFFQIDLLALIKIVQGEIFSTWS